MERKGYVLASSAQHTCVQIYARKTVFMIDLDSVTTPPNAQYAHREDAARAVHGLHAGRPLPVLTTRILGPRAASTNGLKRRVEQQIRRPTTPRQPHEAER
jgi:hypothetical protein